MSHAFSGRFPPGRLVATRAVIDTIPRGELMLAFSRHLSCDWGKVRIMDKQENEYALSAGERLFSVYHSAAGHEFWIITESGRSVTMILLPEEY